VGEEEFKSWLEMLVEAELMPETRLVDLMQEADEITAMTVVSIRTLRARHEGESRI
jgi:hypothetical protein